MDLSVNLGFICNGSSVDLTRNDKHLLIAVGWSAVFSVIVLIAAVVAVVHESCVSKDDVGCSIYHRSISLRTLLELLAYINKNLKQNFLQISEIFGTRRKQPRIPNNQESIEENDKINIVNCLVKKMFHSEPQFNNMVIHYFHSKEVSVPTIIWGSVLVESILVDVPFSISYES